MQKKIRNAQKSKVPLHAARRRRRRGAGRCVVPLPQRRTEERRCVDDAVDEIVRAVAERVQV
jgi:hypothetical protein